jgi:hypothetical protein
MRIALRLIAGLIVMTAVSAGLAAFQPALLSAVKTASGLPCRAARLALQVLHVAAPFVGLLAGLVVFSYPALKRRSLLRPLAGVLLIGLLVGLSIAAWKLRPARLVAEPPKLAAELAGLTVERRKIEALNLSLRGRPGETIRAVLTIDVRGLIVRRCGDQEASRVHFLAEIEQKVRSVEADGRMHITQRWPRVTREIWLGERRIPDADLEGPGQVINLRDLTLEATQEPNGSIRVFKVLGPQGEVANQYIKNLEKATVGHVVMTPDKPVRIGDSWPGGKRDLSIPGGGLLTYMQEARLAGVAHWRGKASR